MRFPRVALIGVALLLAAACQVSPAGAGEASPSASPSPSQADLLARYKVVYNADNVALADASGRAGTDCSSDLASCRADLVSERTASRNMLHDLQGLEIPDCIKAAVLELEQGLQLYIQGASDSIAGLDQDETAVIDRGAGETSQGSDHVDRATSLIAQATC